MRKVNSLEEYKAIIKDNKTKHKHIDTNSFLMKKDIEEMIEAGSFYVEAYSSGIAFFSDEGTYYKCYYHVESEMEFPLMLPDKPVVIDELDKEGRRSAHISRSEVKFHQKGFSYYRTNRQYEKALCSRTSAEKELSGAFHMVFVTASKDERQMDCMQQSVMLWDQNLELADIEKSHRTLKEGSGIVCITSPDKRVVSTEWFHNEGGRSEGRHTVTDPEFRGCGFAKALLYEWCSRAYEAGMKKAVTWIAEDNARSVRLHKSVGFMETGTVCRQYILMPGLEQADRRKVS